MKLIVFFKLSCYFYFNSIEIVEKAMQEGINLANKDLESNAQKVQKGRILRKDFSVPEGELRANFENEKTYRHETICRISRRILQLNFYN